MEKTHRPLLFSPMAQGRRFQPNLAATKYWASICGAIEQTTYRASLPKIQAKSAFRADSIDKSGSAEATSSPAFQ
jgi:hypothetical protein